jgi:Contractile injection system tube protein
MSMRLERLTISAYKDDQFSEKEGEGFIVWMNPESYKRVLKVDWAPIPEINAADAKPTYKRVGGETLSMKLIFDTTGLVPSPLGSDTMPPNGVVDLLEPLISMMARVGHKQTEPNFLQLSWAQLQARCVLKSMDITYKLFRPDGTPIRAEADLTFDVFGSPLSVGRMAANQSKDTAKVVIMGAGDNLPSLCKKIYKDQLLYLSVARYNQISSFRNLKSGTQLIFPPKEELS